MCVIWGIPYLLIRVAVRDLSPATVVCGRTAIAAVMLLPVAAWRGALRDLWSQWPWLLLYTGLEVTGPWLLLSNAEEHLSSSLSGLLVAAVPLVGIVLSRLTGGDEVVDRRRLAGLAIGFGGVVALVGLQLGHIDLAAVAQVGGVAVGYAAGPLVLARRLSQLPSLGVVAMSLTITAVVYAPFAATSHPDHASGQVIASMAGLGVVCTALAFLLFFALISEIGPTRATVITYVNPAVAIALGVVALGEHLTVGMVVGFPLVLIGSVLATAQRSPAAPAEAVSSTALEADLRSG